MNIREAIAWWDNGGQTPQPWQLDSAEELCRILGLDPDAEAPRPPENVETITFRRDEFIRWWNQPSVGGTQHGIAVPREVTPESVEFPPPDPRARKYDTYTDARGLPRHPDRDCTCPPFWETPENVESPLARASRLLSEEQDAALENVERLVPCPVCSTRAEWCGFGDGLPDDHPECSAGMVPRTTPDNVEEPTVTNRAVSGGGS